MAFFGPKHTTNFGPVGVFSRQARLSISAVPHFGCYFTAVSIQGTRAVRWIPPLLAELPQELTPSECRKFGYASSPTVSSGLSLSCLL